MRTHSRMQYVKQLYICFVVLMIFASGLFFSERWRLWEETEVFEGFITELDDFENSVSAFTSCVLLDPPSNIRAGSTDYVTGYSLDKSLWKENSQLFNNSGEPVYVSVRGKFTSELHGGIGCMGFFDYSIEIDRILDIRRYEDRACEPAFYPVFGEIEIDATVEEIPAKQKLAAIKAESFKSVGLDISEG